MHSGATNADADRAPVEVSLQTLLQAGVHFGHQTSRWNPRMAPYLYAVKNGIHIINLPKTLQCWQYARKVIVDTTSRGGSVLFVGTKKQAQDVIIEEAKRCGAFYVARRWLGGMITNFSTIRNSIERLKKLEALLADETERRKYTKKELLLMEREIVKLEFSLGGIREMYAPPKLVFVIDTKREEIAVKEAHRLDIPVVALVDTNCDPDVIDYPIPSNDDATRAIRLFCQAVGDAVNEGRSIYSERAQIMRGKSDEVNSDSGLDKTPVA
ncbi:30S ribosomal protein S2 [bacterium]|nr:30S ribosomal protein S2 [bacterium]